MMDGRAANHALTRKSIQREKSTTTALILVTNGISTFPVQFQFVCVVLFYTSTPLIILQDLFWEKFQNFNFKLSLKKLIN